MTSQAQQAAKQQDTPARRKGMVEKFPGYVFSTFLPLITGGAPDGYGGDLIHCPVCREAHTSTNKTAYVKSDEYAAWNGRGPCLYINMDCQCGHRFQVGFGFHKGRTYIFCRHLELESNENFVTTRNDSGG